MKLLPKHKRKICAAQRKGREKVRDRVVALSGEFPFSFLHCYHMGSRLFYQKIIKPVTAHFFSF